MFLLSRLQTYKFKTDQADDINYVDKLNQAFVRLMSAPVPSVDLLQEEEKEEPVAAKAATKGGKGRR